MSGSAIPAENQAYRSPTSSPASHAASPVVNLKVRQILRSPPCCAQLLIKNQSACARHLVTSWVSFPGPARAQSCMRDPPQGVASSLPVVDAPAMTRHPWVFAVSPVYVAPSGLCGTGQRWRLAILMVGGLLPKMRPPARYAWPRSWIAVAAPMSRSTVPRPVSTAMTSLT
jgi:hypothetical protein